MSGYKVSDFEDGKLIAVEMRHLNPKFQIGAFNVDAVEEADQKFDDRLDWGPVDNEGECHCSNFIKFKE